jgi:hypothetical protein
MVPDHDPFSESLPDPFANSFSEPYVEPGPHDELEPLTCPTMPRPVVGALLIACLFIGLQVSGNMFDKSQGPFATSTIVSTIVGGCIIVGFLKGYRLAWQWGRVLGLLSGGFLALMFLAALNAGRAGEIPVLLTTVVPAALLISMGILLGARQARTYFRLICPDCRSAETQAEDFFFKRAKCKACGRRW